MIQSVQESQITFNQFNFSSTQKLIQCDPLTLQTRELRCFALISDHALSDFTKSSMVQTGVNVSFANMEAQYAVKNIKATDASNAWIQANTSGSTISGIATTDVLRRQKRSYLKLFRAYLLVETL